MSHTEEPANAHSDFAGFSHKSARHLGSKMRLVGATSWSISPRGCDKNSRPTAMAQSTRFKAGPGTRRCAQSRQTGKAGGQQADDAGACGS